MRKTKLIINGMEVECKNVVYREPSPDEVLASDIVSEFIASGEVSINIDISEEEIKKLLS